MTPELYAALLPMLSRDEDVCPKPYDDKTGRPVALQTGGKITIGIGRNLTDRGLNRDEILFLFKTDIGLAEADARHAVGEQVYELLSLNRKAVLCNMAFNLGRNKLLGFTGTLRAVREGRYADAARGMRNSLWAKQVGDRAERLAALMEQG